VKEKPRKSNEFIYWPLAEASGVLKTALGCNLWSIGATSGWYAMVPYFNAVFGGILHERLGVDSDQCHEQSATSAGVVVVVGVPRGCQAAALLRI
jgi:hypothetical protein